MGGEGIKTKPGRGFGAKLRDFTLGAQTDRLPGKKWTRHPETFSKTHARTRVRALLPGAKDNPVDVCLRGEPPSKRPEEEEKKSPWKS